MNGYIELYNLQKQDKNMILLLLMALMAVCAYGEPRELSKFHVSSYVMPEKKLHMELDIAVPRVPDIYPVILFVTGLQGVIPSRFHSNLIDSIAEEGYAFISVSKLQSPNPQKVTHVLQTVIDWLNENIQLVFNNRVPGVIADLQNRFILMGHSAGGHVITEYLNKTCGNVKLQILLDPVDGADPFGFKNDFIITPGKFLPYATPVLIITNQLDHQKKDLMEPACAPQNLSNDRFYNAMSGPKWFLNVSKYGHIDFLNNEIREMTSFLCPTCKKDCNFGQYRTLVKEAAILYSDTSSLQVIQNAEFSIPTTFKHNYMGYDPRSGGYCNRKNSQPDMQVNSQQRQKNLQNS